MRYESIPVHKIVLPATLHRVTIDEDALHELARSIERDGLINPIAVSVLGDAFQLEAGHRRLIAHQRLHRSHIEAKIYEPADQVNGEAIRFNENLQRQDLSPMEEAAAIESALRERNMSTHEIAHMVHRTEAWVRQRLQLVDLPLELADPVHHKRLSIAAALELVKVEDPEHRAYLLRYALDAGATVPVIRDWVSQWLLARAAGDASTAARPIMPADGQPIVIQIPCYVCTTPLPHDQLRILRICPECTHQIAGAGAAAQHQQPNPPTVNALTGGER